MKISKAKSIRGKIKLPGDKSISHRAAIFSALAKGHTKIENFATSLDCTSTLDCLRGLGVKIERTGKTVFVEGVGKNGLKKPSERLDCGNSGTTMRLLSGVLAGQNFDTVLTGDESLSKRPMKRIIEPLGQMNARIEADQNRAPLNISGQPPLRAINYELPVASAQIKSCVLLAGLNADGTTEVISPENTVKRPPSRDHTELMLAYLNADIEEAYTENKNGFAHRVRIAGDSELTARDLQIPADISSAAFFIVAAIGLRGSEITLENVGLNPTRSAIIEVLKSFGAEIEIKNQRKICNESIGDLTVRRTGQLARKDNLNIIGGEIIANLIDEIPILAVFGTQIEAGLEIRDAGELRIKESDRISATVENLKRMNAEVDEFPDGLRIGRSKLNGAEIDSYDDHRIAMAFAIAGLFAEGETTIQGSECAGVSFPEFFDVLGEIKR